MIKISEIDLGSALLSVFILIGFIATAIVILRLAIIGINYFKNNFFQEEDNEEKKKNKIKKKGF